MGTGGSRYGAGRPGWRQKCEQLIFLDICKLDRAGSLEAGRYFSWKWSRGDEPAGEIGIRASVDHVRLIYTWAPYGRDPQSFDYPVPVERTQCRYGGSRPWWRCPRCRSRRAVIYGVASDGRFGCRYCMRLGYSSETEDALSRLWRKQRKLEARLGENNEKPKGMHWRTYERICARIDNVESEKDKTFCIRAFPLFQRCGIKLKES